MKAPSILASSLNDITFPSKYDVLNHLKSLTPILASGGDDDPKKKKTYKTQAEIDQADAFARDFSLRRNEVDPLNAHTGKKVGDPVIQFNDIATGKPYDGRYEQMPQSMIKPLPDWVDKLEWDKQWNMPYYLEGDTINYVDKHWYNHPRFIKSRPEQDQIIAMRK